MRTAYALLVSTKFHNEGWAQHKLNHLNESFVSMFAFDMFYVFPLIVFTTSHVGTCMCVLTRSIQDFETSIDFVQGPPGSRTRIVLMCV